MLQRMAELKPLVLCFNGKGIYEIYKGKKCSIGIQDERLPGTETVSLLAIIIDAFFMLQVVYVMPSTSGRAASYPSRQDKLKFFHELKALRDRLLLQKGTRTESSQQSSPQPTTCTWIFVFTWCNDVIYLQASSSAMICRWTEFWNIIIEFGSALLAWSDLKRTSLYRSVLTLGNWQRYGSRPSCFRCTDCCLVVEWCCRAVWHLILVTYVRITNFETDLDTSVENFLTYFGRQCKVKW